MAAMPAPWFVTDVAMYAAVELRLIALTLPSDLRPDFGGFLDRLARMSEEQMVALLGQAGMGPGLHTAPGIRQRAEALGQSPDAYLDDYFAGLAQQAGLDAADMPSNLSPVFLEYAGGDPRYVMPENSANWATLRWDPRRVDTALAPGAYGQALLRQVGFIADRLGRNRGQSGDSAALNDFLGLLAIETVTQKLQAMQDVLPISHDGAMYFPAAA